MKAINLQDSQHQWQTNNQLSSRELQDKAVCADTWQLQAALLQYPHSSFTSLILTFPTLQPEVKCSDSLSPVSC